ncbi:hypothetical protein [Pirellulimonas nuda]|nr:hypothetical protein [Pirellulimonas nuda]
MITLGEDAGPEVLESAAQPLAGRDEAAARVKRLQGGKLLARSLFFSGITVDGQPLHWQMGISEPTVSAVSTNQRGSSFNIQYRDVGVVLEADCDVLSDSRIQIALKLQESHLEQSDIPIQQVAGEEPILASQTVLFSHASRVVCNSSGALVVFSSSVKGDAKDRTIIVYLAGTILE